MGYRDISFNLRLADVSIGFFEKNSNILILHSFSCYRFFQIRQILQQQFRYWKPSFSCFVATDMNRSDPPTSRLRKGSISNKTSSKYPKAKPSKTCAQRTQNWILQLTKGRLDRGGRALHTSEGFRVQKIIYIFRKIKKKYNEL